MAEEKRIQQAEESYKSVRPNGVKANGVSRPSVVPLNYSNKSTLQKAYMGFTKGGGLFIPTTKAYRLHEEVFLLVTLPDSKKSLPIPGAVVWQTPAGAMGGWKQGIGVEFKGKEGNALKNRIEGILGTKVSAPDPNYTM